MTIKLSGTPKTFTHFFIPGLEVNSKLIHRPFILVAIQNIDIYEIYSFSIVITNKIIIRKTLIIEKTQKKKNNITFCHILIKNKSFLHTTNDDRSKIIIIHIREIAIVSNISTYINFKHIKNKRFKIRKCYS